ncbi:MAG: hypothetical protein GTN86_10320 [Xanthomonadales bacterium]|nr:hypothetical protein [Xanthomonadales bacterium]NIN58547.1 hypothetical protein [Xanthomonadales bacterium]NIN73836.1 hypothetical protein [Xanthomonadales bacterium]NIO12305.1 hypothetical protein [Xanthomonadales bacterium]NIP10940.1 hypothetical protein [Xanthomonadales bacterium]
MQRIEHQLPTLIATSVVRGSQQGESHGGVYLVDFAAQTVDQVVDWNTGEIDWQGRGWDRGLRGIAFFGGETYIAASDELFVYGQDFRIKRSFRNPYLKHCHEIHQLNKHLYLTSTGHDSVLAFDLEQQRFFWAIHLALGEDGPVGTAYDPNGINGPGGANGPPARNLLHLNNVFADATGMYVSGMRTGGILRIGDGNRVRMEVELPEGIHNARPFGAGVLFNDTAADHLRYVRRDGGERRFAIPRYEPAELTHTELGDEKVARQGFGRGLCVVDEQLIAAGSSPSTVTLYELQTGDALARVNFSMDIRNAIHGLEVWPYGTPQA